MSNQKPRGESFPLLRKAYAIIDGIPEDRFDLSSILHGGNPNPHACGTIACAAGWIAMHPDFQELGLTLTSYGSILFNGHAKGCWIVMAEILGITVHDSIIIFDGRNDFERRGKLGKLSDKELWKYRVRKFLLRKFLRG